MDAKIIKEHLKKRLYESALNNVGVTVPADDVFKDIAEYRIDIWIDELYKQEEFKNELNKLNDELNELKNEIDAVNLQYVIFKLIEYRRFLERTDKTVDVEVFDMAIEYLSQMKQSITYEETNE